MAEYPMSGTTNSKRPLSPHLTIYRRQITSVLSILHRITGVGLVVPAALIVWWLLAAGSNPTAFGVADAVLTSWFGKTILTLSLWAFWYHFANGIRHLVWDSGRGFELVTVTRSGVAVVVASVVLTVLTLLVGSLQ
jgi:succinate dehydrogenase / fumarate reductase, cytochrome b subunit